MIFWVIMAIIAIVALVALFTDNEKVKNFKEGLEDKADELKRQIREKEDYIAWLAREIDALRSREGYLVKKAIRLYRFCQILLLIIVASMCFMAHAIYSLSIAEFLITVFATVGILLSAITFVAFNEIGNFNRILSLLREGFINIEFRRNNFQPVMIRILEDRLINECRELEELRGRQKELMP